MGGGGSYYDRDVSTGRVTSAGYTSFAQEQMSRGSLAKELLPKDRRVLSRCGSPLVYALDVTGSMGILPKIIFDKMPMIAGQIVEQGYLNDTQVSLAAVGDVLSDSGPLQICDFSPVKELDAMLKKIWVEGNGGGQHFESYEFIAYYYARLYDMENAELPIILFTGDESFRETMTKEELQRHFGGQHGSVDSFTIFNELKAKFKGNVFLLHRHYGGYGLNGEIVNQWERALGKGFVIELPEDKAVADLTLGILAIASGKRTLAQYIRDIKNRPLEMGGVKYAPQSEERIQSVASALAPLEVALKGRGVSASQKKTAKANQAKKKSTTPKKKGLRI